MKMQELDLAVSFREQLADSEREPVVLVNVFYVPDDKVDAFLSAWTDDARFMKAQSGCLAAQLHRGVAGSSTFMNYAIWESVATFRDAVGSPAFLAKREQYPEGVTASPALFRKVAVSEICAS